MIDAAGIRGDHVNFVSVDFSVDDLFSKLVASGFDASRNALFLWEGVSLLLIRRTSRSDLGDGETASSVWQRAGGGSLR